jgi:uncharacterized protein (DUF1330 family)
MAAYIIAQIRVTDPGRYAEYRAGVPAAVEKYGGRFLVRGSDVDVLEGKHDGRRVVVLEFPTMAKLRAFWDSPEYADLRTLRQSASDGDLWAVEGA